ncbi:unnamed protein product [Cyprideis torosa]|uniref:Uncharacterized protein n=1 Tax=Cyprideis torosa TaxID=163714 RepID=A0A7R8ZN58_9CRUS|nr:unnamed protein product [Cyprideis torosa]CAG0897212.1 unnamed protein product [Cyprideis torosa]
MGALVLSEEQDSGVPIREQTENLTATGLGSPCTFSAECEKVALNAICAYDTRRCACPDQSTVEDGICVCPDQSVLINGECVCPDGIDKLYQPRPTQGVNAYKTTSNRSVADDSLSLEELCQNKQVESAVVKELQAHGKRGEEGRVKCGMVSD